MEKFNLITLNEEFVELLAKHEGDTDVTGPSREAFQRVKEDFDYLYGKDTLTEDDVEAECCYRAMACNAYDELCSKHEGLRETYDWYYGAEHAGVPNEYDLYVGTDDYDEMQELLKQDCQLGKIMDTIYDFTLTMNGDILVELFGEHLGNHLWDAYYGLRRDWMRWYGYLDYNNRAIIQRHIQKLINKKN